MMRMPGVFAVQWFLLVTVVVAVPGLTHGEEPRLVTPVLPALTSSAKGTDLSSLALSSTMRSSSVTNNLFSEPATLTGRYTMNGSIVIPYIGLGFGGGETTDVNRTVVRQSALQSSIQQDRLMNDVLGKTLVPNEFQLGIRIPF
jgi:hypothetical protein